MKFTVQYIPLNKIKTDGSLKVTERIKKFQLVMWDCMHLLVVKKNKKSGNYMILTGHSRLQYLRKHTNKLYVPCIIDDDSKGLRSWFNRFKQNPFVAPKSWSMIWAFIKREPEFRKLTKIQQMKLLLLAFRYKRTVVTSMRSRLRNMRAKH